MPLLAIYHRPEHRTGYLYAVAMSQTVYFTWAAVVGATSYVLCVGPSSGIYTTYMQDVGNVLVKALVLEPGTYYSRVVPYTGDTAGDATDEQTVTV